MENDRMTSKRVVYVVEPRDGGEWAAQRRGTERAAVVTENKANAINEARRLAQQHTLRQVVIKNENGTDRAGIHPRRGPAPFSWAGVNSPTVGLTACARFDLTDKTASEIGLPVRPGPPELGEAP